MAGIENERFYVWMRTAALPKFRKLYAIIKDDISAGDTVTLSITANFDVRIVFRPLNLYIYEDFAHGAMQHNDITRYQNSTVPSL